MLQLLGFLWNNPSGEYWACNLWLNCCVLINEKVLTPWSGGIQTPRGQTGGRFPPNARRFFLLCGEFEFGLTPQILDSLLCVELTLSNYRSNEHNPASPST